LPAIRSFHVGFGSSIDEPALTRGDLLDRRLTALISSVTTALDHYRALASEAAIEEFKPEGGGAASEKTVADAVANTQALDATLADAERTVQEVTTPTSQKADDLKRQLKDTRGLNTIASAEVRMPAVVPGWLAKTIQALREYPDIIDRTMKNMEVGVDVAEVFLNRWLDFKKAASKGIVKEIRKTIRSIREAMEVVRKARGETAGGDDREDRPSNVEVAMARRAELQKDIRKLLDAMDDLDEIDVAHFNTGLARAELTFFKIMAELQSIETFLDLNRRYATPTRDATGSGVPPLVRAGSRLAQRVFERLVLIAMRRLQRPLTSRDVVEELRRMGHPIGGQHEIKTAYNRLWQAKTRGVLLRVGNDGYWDARQPVPSNSAEAARLARIARRRTRRPHGDSDGRPTGQPHGRTPLFGSEQIEAARKMLLSGMSFKEVANTFALSPATVRRHFRGGVEALRAKYPDEAGPIKPRGRRLIYKKGIPRPGAGRRPTISNETINKIVELRDCGVDVKDIADELRITTFMVYRYLKKRKTSSPQGAPDESSALGA
jgi:DNA invertase Pin-like site-specific DNA recombinase